MSGLNLVDQLKRLAFRRDQVKPAPRNHQSRRQAEHPVGYGIAMMMVVKEPTVEVTFAQRSLNGGEVHGRTTIVNNDKELSESESRLESLGFRARLLGEQHLFSHCRRKRLTRLAQYPARSPALTFN